VRERTPQQATVSKRVAEPFAQPVEIGLGERAA